MKIRLRVVLLAPMLIALLSACGGGRQMLATPAWAPMAIPAAKPEKIEYRVAPGDHLIIKLYYHPELNTEVWVRPDGFISLELAGEIKVAGLTPAVLDTLLEARYSRKLINPEVAVIVKDSATLKVFVGGEVNSPGLVSIDGGMTLMGAIFQAGGFTSSAQTSRITLLRKDARALNGVASRPLAMAFDLRGALRGDMPEANIELMPYDVIYVPKSGIARAGKFVDDYIEGILPVSTLSGFAWVYTLVKK